MEASTSEQEEQYGSMDVDLEASQPSTSATHENLVPLNNDYGYIVEVESTVGLHVEGPVPFINPELPMEQHAIVQIVSNEGDVDNPIVEGISPSISETSTREPSPVPFNEESNQNDDENTTQVISEIGVSRKRNLSDDEQDEDEGKLCPICLDNWTNTGDHRICALKCGHLFGYKCVNRWLDSQSKKSCPTCKKKVGRGDLRYIYAKKLIAVDTTELDIIQKQLDTAIEEKNRLLLDVSKYVCREHLLNHEISQLKRQVEELSKRGNIQPSKSNTSENQDIVKLYMDKSLEICRQSGCRVFDANCKLDLIMATMKSPNSLFAGYGIRKVNISQYKPLAFIPLHNLQIRDICFHTENNWVLSASMDKSFKVIDCNTNCVLHTGMNQMPLWACCWDAQNHFNLYIGTQTGAVLKYDMRQLSEPLSTFSVQGDMSPVVSIASVPSTGLGEISGVISCKLNSLWFFEYTSNSFVQHPLTLDGPFVCMKYQQETKQLLVSSRPNNRIPYSRHTLCTLDRMDGGIINCNTIHCYQGGGMQKLLSKSCFLTHKKDYVAAHHEASKSVFLWSVHSGQKVCSVPAHDTVLDVKGIQNHTGDYLVSLTEKKLEFFKFLN